MNKSGTLMKKLILILALFVAYPALGQKASLLADREFSSTPPHLAVVGKKGEPAATELFAAAVAYPSSYERVE